MYIILVYFSFYMYLKKCNWLNYIVYSLVERYFICCTLEIQINKYWNVKSKFLLNTEKTIFPFPFILNGI